MKQTFHKFLFNITNYLTKVSNIQWREVELNIILTRVNKFDITPKIARNICFVIYTHSTKQNQIEWMLTKHTKFQWQYNFTIESIPCSKYFYAVFVVVVIIIFF